jgi:CheY-like chemotaxis protein
MKIAKVMIVDDDDDVRAVTALAASKIGGWDVVSVASGEAAIEQSRGERPDVILLDVMMPSMDGPATMARLREDPVTADTPIIFLTAKVQQHEVVAYLALGAQGVIRKPFDVTQLPSEIQRIVDSNAPAEHAFEDELAAMRERVRPKLQRDLRQLDARARNACDAAADTVEVEAARELAHRLMGTSGSFGFDGCSNALARIERRLESLVSAGGAVAESAWSEIETALSEAAADLV